MEKKIETKKTIKILVTNDDGIGAEGLLILADAASSFGEVIVVAPEQEQSAMSHSITVRNPLIMKEHRSLLPHLRSYTVNGTPADCVIAAREYLELVPDLIFSGINNGPNLGHDILYSGTVGAASEGSASSIPSAAFSSLRGDLTVAQKEIGNVLSHLFRKMLWSQDTLINVNFPVNRAKSSRGILYTRMGAGLWNEDGFDPRCAHVGEKTELGIKEADTDISACSNGYISITPLKIDRTSFDQLERWRSEK